MPNTDAFESPRGSREPAASRSRLSDARDYAVIEAAFLSAFAVLAVRSPKAPMIPWRELPVLALATFALADVIAHEKVSTWLREPFVVESGDHRPLGPAGSGLRYAVGELLTCTRCVGTWSALGLVGLRTASPPIGRLATTVLAVAGANDILQSGFRLLNERANQAAKN